MANTSTKQRRQRPKSSKKWPPWLRNRRLLRGTINIAICIHRLLRFLWTLKDMFWS